MPGWCRSWKDFRTGVATSYNLPYRGASGNNVHIPDDSRELFNIADQYDSSDGFFELLGIPFVDGRAPRGDLEIAVDEKFVARMAEFTDWSDGAVGKQVFVTEHGPVTDDEIPYYFTITGVYKSYLIGNLQGVDPRPSVMFHGEIGTDYMPHILFKVNNPASLPAVRAALEQTLEGGTLTLSPTKKRCAQPMTTARKCAIRWRWEPFSPC